MGVVRSTCLVAVKKMKVGAVCYDTKAVVNVVTKVVVNVVTKAVVNDVGSAVSHVTVAECESRLRYLRRPT